jgi:hypothetical protein
MPNQPMKLRTKKAAFNALLPATRLDDPTYYPHSSIFESNSK